MNDVPLIQKADINSINTSIIAIKKQLKQLTEAVGLIDVPDMPDLSPFVKKTDVADVVEADNMNPVTSNAVAEYTVDEVTSGNMHSVTSNAVAVSGSYSTNEIDTGLTYADGKKIYKRTISTDVTTYADSGSRREFVYRLEASNIDTIVKEEGCWKWVTASSGQGRIVPIHCTSVFSTLLVAYSSYSVMENGYLNIAFASDKSNYSITKMRVEASILYTKTS